MVNVSKFQAKSLIKFAKSVIQSQFDNSIVEELPYEEVYNEQFGLFVNLNKKGNLRGCVGYISGYKSLRESVREMAISAAFKDNRFPQLSESEMDDITIEISILSPLERIKSSEEIVVGTHGLYIQNDYLSGLLLPQVATEYKWTRDEFIHHVCDKAGIENYNFEDSEFYKFTALILEE